MGFKTTVREWFRTGLRPTESQFSSFFDKIFWKDEQIPVESIEGLQAVFDEKADADALNSHLTDVNAHPQLLQFARVIPYGEVLTFKTTPDGDQKTKEIGDVCLGYVDGQFIFGTYTGDNTYNNIVESEI